MPMTAPTEPQVLDILRQSACQKQCRILFPESNDPRVLAAAGQFQREGLGRAMLILPTQSLDPESQQALDSALQAGVVGLSLEDASLIEVAAENLFENRQHKGMSLDSARQAVREPLTLASCLVKKGHADAGVAGSLATTSSVIRAGLYGIGARGSLVSSFFLMQWQQRAFSYADCGVVPDPDANQLAEIAIDTAANHFRLTGQTPKVAMLSFSTLGSARHPRADKVIEATRLVRQRAPELIVDGELQFDAAFEPSVASRKAPHSAVAGQANVFVFPDLDSGNIAYKVTQRVGGAVALGPLVQGLLKPFMDLSRGCSVQDIVDVAVIASNLADEPSEP